MSQGATPTESDKRYCAPSFHANKPAAITQCVAGCWIIYLVLHRFHELAKNCQALKVGVGRKMWDWELSKRGGGNTCVVIKSNNNVEWLLYFPEMHDWMEVEGVPFLITVKFSLESTIWSTLKTSHSVCVIERRGKYCIMTSMSWVHASSTICPSENKFRLVSLAQGWIRVVMRL